MNKTVQNLLKERSILHMYGYNDDIKAAVAERFNRTLKEKIWKHFTQSGTYEYLKVLPDIVNGLNHSYSRPIKMRPVDVTLKNEVSPL